MKSEKKSAEEKSSENNLGNKSENLLPILKEACEGLFYISETDAEFEAFVWKTDKPIDEISGEIVLKLAGEKPNAKVAEKTLDDFFKHPTEMQDWFGDEEKAQVEKYLKLKDLLATKLKNTKVFKVGDVQINIYIVGIGGEGNLEGVKTKAVET
ncbi:MAG: nuclease A inhibitor family protein [Acidobacteriota bacterium]|nr:nuclease A inhibitor family protein [Acidobacteriota bacterium]